METMTRFAMLRVGRGDMQPHREPRRGGAMPSPKRQSLNRRRFLAAMSAMATAGAFPGAARGASPEPGHAVRSDANRALDPAGRGANRMTSPSATFRPAQAGPAIR